MAGETFERLATLAFGILFEFVALFVYLKAAEAAEPIVVVLALVLLAGGLVLVARASDRFL